MKKNQFLAGGMLAVMLFTQVCGNISLLAAEDMSAKATKNESGSYTFNNEGIWLTEIYQNDVDRSNKNNSREKNGYESINLYTTTTDLMEFIEITSTYNEAVSFNDMYEVYYNNTLLTVTDMEGNSDIMIQPDESVVLWNYRDDVTTGIPTEEEFRKDMRISDSAKILKVTCGANWATTATFSLKNKADGKVTSTFKATDKIDTMDGFSVELKIPDIGSEMEIYQAMNEPSPGKVYSGQLNGLVTTQVPDSQYANGVYITEIRPNDSNRSGAYGSSSDLMECLEIVNTTDHTIDLNDEYQMLYCVKEGSRKPLTMYHYDANAENQQGTSENCTVPAGSSAVLWCYRSTYLTDYTSYPTETQFREAYGIAENVPVYIFTAQNGLNNTNRGFDLYKLNIDGTKSLESYYCYNGTTDLKDNKSVNLMVNPEGPEMLILARNAASTIGAVALEQYSYLKDDGSAMALELDGEVPASIMQGEELRVNFKYTQSETLPRTGITTYYRFDGEGSWYSNTEISRRVPNLYESMISADQLFSHDYVEFYVSADNRYRSTLSDIYKVEIDKLNDIVGIRTNIGEGEEVSGTVSITANDGGDNSSSEIYLDGNKLETVPMFEDGAYFNFNATGRDSYFRNAVTTTSNEIIASITKWQYRILDGQAMHIDNSYFTYNEENHSYDTTLRFWAGTYGTTVDEYLMPDANREDFNVTELAMKLINGNIYYPTAIGPNDDTTSAKTNLSTSYDAVHAIGDSTAMCPYMDVSFSIPDSEVTAVGTEVDTTKLSNGEHMLIVKNETGSKEVKFIVDNAAPEINIGIEDGSELTGNILIAPQITESNTLEESTVILDGEEIEAPYESTAYKLGKGEHTIEVFAKDMAGNENSKLVTFTITNVDITLTDAGAKDITDSSASLYLTLENAADTNVVFYKAEEIDTTGIETDKSTGILPYIKYTINVSDAENEDTIIANWDGKASNSDGTHASTMYVLNTVNGKWDEVAKADSEGSIKGAAIAVENHIKDGSATIIVQCTADSALPELDTNTDGVLSDNLDWDGSSVPKDYDFSFAWETDTQYYAEEYQYHYLNMNNWIVDNADKLGIKYVIHTGDIVDDYDMIYEWENADDAMSIFDNAGMPYGVLGGNHDVSAGAEDYENYTNYFGENRFTSQPTYGGSYENNRGHYDLISEGGQDFIILYMSWNIYQNEIDWMNEILQKYSDRKAILCFHTYTNVKYSSDTLLDYFGQLVQEQVVAKNPNVFAVLNGHYHGSSYETAMFDDNNDGINDRTVYQICTDYQSGFEGGSEYIKFLYFDLDNNKIYMNSYSPYMNDFNYYDTDIATLNVEGASGTAVDEMILDVDFNSEKQSILEDKFSAYICKGEELGTAPVDDNNNAILNVSALNEKTDYVWYAVASNENTGYLKTDLYKFTTLEKGSEGNNSVDNNKKPNDSTNDADKGSSIKPIENQNVQISNNNTASSGNVESVKTGDKFPIVPIVFSSIAGLAAAGAFVFKKRKA